MIKQMGEAKAKFVKVCNDENLKNVKRIMEAGQAPGIASCRQILDTICKFVTNNIEATYAVHGKDIFQDADSYSQAIKNCTPTDRDRVWLQGVAKGVNMDVEGQKGELFSAVSAP